MNLFKILTISFSFLDLDWLLFSCLIGLLFIQIFVIIRRNPVRFWLKFFLNLYVWCVLFLYVLAPKWSVQTKQNQLLLLSQEPPSSFVQRIKDSLHISESLTIASFNKHQFETPNFVKQFDKIYLVGQDFSPDLLSQLSNKKMLWLPYFKDDSLQEIHWNALLRKGEQQDIFGKIALVKAKTLKICYGNSILDSVLLKKGVNSFHLHFPVFTQGKTNLSLKLGNNLLKNIPFFVRKNQEISVKIMLNNPDFESKILADWLGKNGNEVEIQTEITKNAQNKTFINHQNKPSKGTSEIIITDPSFAANAMLKKAVSEGKSVLFMNFRNPEQELKIINTAFGTNFKVKRISNDEHIKINDKLNALPFQFVENFNQNIDPNFPVAIQKTRGKVGVSLLEETFPIKLSGDSLYYAKIWSSILQKTSAPLKDNIFMEAPIFQDLKTEIILNKLSNLTNKLSLEKDTVLLENSSINPFTAKTSFRFRNEEWQSFQDSLAVYVEKNNSDLSKAAYISQFLKAQEGNLNLQNPSELVQTFSHKMPDWLWFLLLLIGLTALWIEPKLDF